MFGADSGRTVSRPWGDGYDIGAYEYREGEIGADSQERKETKTKEDSKVDEAPSATQREQPLEARATNHSVEAASEGQYNTAPPADSTWLISPKSLLLVLAAVSLLAVAWFIGR
jgi:hypothetical protein